MNVLVTFDGEGWWVVTVNGVDVGAFNTSRDAQIFARYHTTKVSNANSVDHNRGFNQ